MRLAIGYSTKDQIELTKQTLPIFQGSGAHIHWCDGSATPEGVEYFERYSGIIKQKARVTGGADAAIAWKLSTMLASGANYTHIGLLENDVLLDPDWLAPTLELFEKGKADGIAVGAVSPRSYVDRIVIQRAGYSVMHNIGAGAIIFTREAAEIVLRTFRTNWWPDNVRLFAQLSGIDLRTYAAFRGNEQCVTTDWGWEAQLARHGLASLALTPAQCTMVGQNPPLAEQGLELTSFGMYLPNSGSMWLRQNSAAFELYRDNLAAIRSGLRKIELPDIILRQGGSMLFFPHQIGHLAGSSWQGTLELKWRQGFGPFAYRAGAGGASLAVRISGSSSFLVTGGDAGAQVTIEDTRSGFKTSPTLQPSPHPVGIQVPGGPIPRLVTLDMVEGAVFYGLSCNDPQLLDTTWRFDWGQLPEAK